MYYQLVENGQIKTDPQEGSELLERLQRRLNLTITYEELINYNWYECENYGDINPEFQHYDPAGAVIDEENKKVVYTILDKTPELIEQYRDEVKSAKIDMLWRAATSYELSYLSGSAAAMLAVLLVNRNSKGMAVKDWIDSIWGEYYARKAQVQADWTYLPNESFYDIRAIPHSIPELKDEYDAIMSQ